MSFEKERHIFWLVDPTVLFKNNNFTIFIPGVHMTRIEQLNAITRFSLYFLILSLMFEKNAKWLYIPILTIILCATLYFIHHSDYDSKKKEINRLINIRNRDKLIKETYDARLNNISHESKEFFPPFEKDPNSPIIEAGVYDADGNLHIGPKPSIEPYTQQPPEQKYTVDEMIEYEKATCRRPTRDNPFMNPNISHYGTDKSPGACNIEDPEIADEVELYFNKDLYRDVEDIWNRKNSQRQFYTIPSTSIPNKQKEFANWLYDIPFSCKQNQQNCLRYEDIRFRR